MHKFVSSWSSLELEACSNCCFPPCIPLPSPAFGSLIWPLHASSALAQPPTSCSPLYQSGSEKRRRRRLRLGLWAAAAAAAAAGVSTVRLPVTDQPVVLTRPWLAASQASQDLTAARAVAPGVPAAQTLIEDSRVSRARGWCSPGQAAWRDSAHRALASEAPAVPALWHVHTTVLRGVNTFLCNQAVELGMEEEEKGRERERG